MNPRAVTYRRLHDIPADWGTAVNVQAMVFGNMGDDCATGVCFTRDPSTGENAFFGEYLVNAQGEDVVAGIRTPQPLSRARAKPGEAPMERRCRRRTPSCWQSGKSSKPLPRHAGHRVHRREGAGSICCRRATASAPRRPACASPSRWRTKG